MKRLVFNKYFLLLFSIVLLFACQHRKEALTEKEGLEYSKKDPLLIDSTKAIIHGSQHQHELDSLKRVKEKKKDLNLFKSGI